MLFPSCRVPSDISRVINAPKHQHHTPTYLQTAKAVSGPLLQLKELNSKKRCPGDCAGNEAESEPWDSQRKC